jgi:L-ribulose-5-phosphate 3-epimerase
VNDLKIAVMPNCLSHDHEEGLRLTAELGVPGVHISAGGDWAPQALDAAGRKQVKKLVNSFGLEISAISGWGGNVDLCEREHHAEAIPEGKLMLELAADLECGLWQAHVGVMPWEQSDPKWQAVLDAAGALAAHGEKVGATLCIETGPEPPRVLKRLLEIINSPGLAINYDPANLIIWPVILCQMAGKPYDQDWAMEYFDPHEGARLLAPWVRHTHAKDALVKEDGDHLEVPLGEGWVDWPRYVNILRDGGFNGYFAIEREVGQDRVGDARRGVEFLRSLPL